MAMTTNSSISVNPRAKARGLETFMELPLSWKLGAHRAHWDTSETLSDQTARGGGVSGERQTSSGESGATLASRDAGCGTGSVALGRISRGWLETTKPVAGWSPQGQLTTGIGRGDFFFWQQDPLVEHALAAARRQHPHEQAPVLWAQQQPADLPPALAKLPGTIGIPTLPARNATSVMNAATRRRRIGS
ncbi:MAG TPA: hypothetical protein VL475_09150 [Planctomycetaceae bacterium]|nr:hypothetical protein [Planctomycetaceae bacterium]